MWHKHFVRKNLGQRRETLSALRLMRAQLRVKWPKLLDGIAAQLNPIDQIFRRFRVGYYWSTYQSSRASKSSE